MENNKIVLGAGDNTMKTMDSVIVVQQASDFGVVDSTKVYKLDGIVDMGSTSIVVPPTGITIIGESFDVSGLVSSEDNYTMFTSETPVIGSGNVIIIDALITASGANSKVYELYDATGFNAVEVDKINYNDCTSVGDLHNYRQGLEVGTGRFGGTPTMTLHGTWLGGFRITTSIVRSLSASMTDPLFKEGTAFSMESRFLTDINCDLPTSAALLDFSPANFPNSGTVQLQGCEITRDGVYNADDSNLTPNIDRGDLASYWKNNNGLPNTFVGATSSIIGELATSVAAASTWYDINGTFTGTGAQHFTASSDGKLTHDGNSPREFEIAASLTLDSNPNDELVVRFMKWDDSASALTPLDYTQQIRQVNSLVGGRDVAFFTIIVGGVLDRNDYLLLQVMNNSGSNDVTMELGSYFRIQER